MWTITLTLSIVHFCYHQLITNFDLYPLNNIRSYTPPQKFTESGLHAMIFGFTIIALYFHNYSLTGLAVIGQGLLLIDEFLSWWRYYFFGMGNQRKFMYERIYKNTLQILPPIKDHPKPNLELCILHVTTLFCFASTLWLLFAS